MLIAALALLPVLAAPASVDEYAATRLDCPPIKDWRPYAPRERRIADRKRAMRACRKLGASKEACNVLDVIAIRESSGDACAVHKLGPNEFGLGIHALSVEMHIKKWTIPCKADVPPERCTVNPAVLRIPEVSTVVTLRIFRRAVVRYKARTWREVGGVFAGRRYADGDEFLFCRRLERVGIDCEGDPRDQLGERLGREPELGQDAFVLELLAQRGR